MFPISDDNTGRRVVPYVNYALIVVNILVFILFQGFGTNNAFTLAYATVPAEILTNRDFVNQELLPTPIPVYLTIFTAMFMHGGIAHLFGNMLFLYIFGDNVEDRMGHGRYLLFYLTCGILATLSHIASCYVLDSGLTTPSLGASGAISGVMAGYLVLFPKNKVRVVLFYFITQVPAMVAIGVWFVFQLISGLGMLGGSSDGVAYAAHIGGFVAGLLLVRVFAPKSALMMAKSDRQQGLFR